MNKAIGFAFAALSLFFIHHQDADADVVLTFDQSGVGNGSAVDQNYGDRVVAATDGSGNGYDIIAGTGLGLTPNVEVSYTGGLPAIWTTGYGDLTNVLYDEQDFNDGFEIIFEADSGFEVGLFGFDLAAFGAVETVPGIEILDGDSNVLWSVGSTAISGTERNSFDTGGVFAEALTIAIDVTGLDGGSDNVGIDNIQFGQRVSAIPEPATTSLVFAAMLGLVQMRRRHTLECRA